MELTLKRLLEQAEFTPLKGRSRGYDSTEVDDFLDRASAMAAKVEVQLTQALEAAANSQGGAPAPDIEAEIERRVAERLAAAPSGPSEEDSAEEVRRTIVLAQRTADAAVREAREDAEKLLADARERATTMVAEAEAKAAALSSESEETATRTVAEAEARAAALSAEAEAQVARERREARQRLAAEITELEGIRESLRSDTTVIETHVEEQRLQLSSTIAELSRLLEDPTGFRLAPVPVLIDPDIPDLSFDVDPPEIAAEPVAEAPAPVAAEPVFATPAAPTEIAAEPEAPAVVIDPIVPEADLPDLPPLPPPPAPPVLDLGSDGAADPAAPQSATVAQPLSFEDVDHAEPDLAETEVEETGPPTAPVPAIDLGIDLTGPAGGAPVSGEGLHDDDAFLAELRKAMADDEPLGPRDHDEPGAHGEMFDDDDRRSWRFGRKR